MDRIVSATREIAITLKRALARPLTRLIRGVDSTRRGMRGGVIETTALFSNEPPTSDELKYRATTERERERERKGRGVLVALEGYESAINHRRESKENITLHRIIFSLETVIAFVYT